jgi:dipeptidyl aminopeptidase/acylaminoacyl peptidase
MTPDKDAVVSLTPTDVARMWIPSDPRVSPDGRLVAWCERRMTKPLKAKELPSVIRVAPSDGARPARRWTPDTSSARDPRWSPDGRWLAFLSDRAEPGVWQLYRTPSDGGEAEQLTSWQGGIESYGWSPEGERIAFTAADEAWHTVRKGREDRGEDVDAWGERLGYRRLRLLHLRGGAIATLGPDNRHVTGFAWAPGGDEVAVALAARPDLEAPAELGAELTRMAVDGSAARRVTHVPFGPDSLTWTADGALLFSHWEANRIPSSRAVWRVAADGGAMRCLTTGMEACVLSIQRPAAVPDILVTLAEGLTTRLYEIDPGTGSRTLRFAPSHGAASEISTDASGRVTAAVVSAGAAPPEVWCAGAAGGPRRLSDCNPALVGVSWAEQEPFHWTAPDGLALDGLALRPRDPSTAPPGVVLVHGGPYGRWADGFNLGATNWAQWLALAGYAVFLPNPRGGMGRGHAFADTVAGTVGMADWLDVASGADAFVRARRADRDRLGIGGWSQGGFMTAWAVSGGIPEGAGRGWNTDYTAFQATPDDRFRCGVDGAGPTDWGAMVSESDLPTFEAMLGGSRPGEGIGPHRHALVSPLSYATRVRTPLLIVHGRDDARVPVGQATGFFHERRRRGVPVEMALSPREPHGPREEAHVIDLLDRVRAWYGRWLRNGVGED